MRHIKISPIGVKLIILWLLLILSLFIIGCQPYYIQPSEPHLTGSPWILTDYYITVTSSISDVEVITDETVCITAFGKQSYFGDGILMKQNYNVTSPDRRFVVGETTWEFDDNSYTLYVNGNIDRPYHVMYPSYMRYEKTELRVDNPYNGGVTSYTFFTDAIAANYPRKLTLISPPIVSDLLLSQGMRDKAVTVQIQLIFMR